MSQDLYELFFQSSNEGLALLDAERKFKLINESFAKIVGYDRNELIGKSFEVLVPNEVKKRHKHHTKNFDKNPSQRSMGRNAALSAQHKNGHNVPVEISLNPIEINGEKYLLNYRGKKTYVQAERKAQLVFDRIELIGEGGNEINQEDTVKFKVLIKNNGY